MARPRSGGRLHELPGGHRHHGRRPYEHVEQRARHSLRDGTESCTTSASCTGAPLECITTVDCVDAGTPPGTVCCGYDDAMKLQRSACAQGSACVPTLAAGSECTQPGFTSCAAHMLPAPAGFAFCAAH